MRIASCAVMSLMILYSSFAGCIHTNNTESVEDTGGETFQAYSIVAPIDTGINVYHDHFVLNETLPNWSVWVAVKAIFFFLVLVLMELVPGAKDQDSAVFLMFFYLCFYVFLCFHQNSAWGASPKHAPGPK